MGTSGSSAGPGGGVPFDPPWLDDIEMPQLNGNQQPKDQEQNIGNPGTIPSQSPELSPLRRFANARRALGEFARTGSEDAFRRAVGHYSRTGMGGARNAAIRMRTSSRAGVNVFHFLQSVRERTDPTIKEWVDSLIGRGASAQEIADEIIRYVIPNGGSQDEAICQQSMAQAMEDFLVDNPIADLLNLSDKDIWGLIESFLAYEAFNRLCLDIGQVFEDASLSPRERVMRMNEMRDYLKAELFAQIEELRTDTPKAASGQLQTILQSALQNTFAVYEGSI